MRLVASSDIGAVERDQAIRLLIERATLTRMVCREWQDSPLRESDRRPQAALWQLLHWIGHNQPDQVRGEPYAQDGLEQMAVPPGYAELYAEIHAGAKVCHALFMMLTADTMLQWRGDIARINAELAEYWERFPVPVPVKRTVP